MAIEVTNDGIKKDDKLVYSFEDSYINFEKPFFDKPIFEKTAPAGLKILTGLKVRVGSVDVTTSSDVSLGLDTDLDSGTKVAGTDYYIYAKSDNTFYISANKTITDDRLIGGFHYGLVAESEAPTGNKTEADMVNIRGINTYSLWDLKFRAIAGNDGMALVGTKWYDIYLLNNEHIDNGTSKAGLTIAGGTTDNGRAIPKIPLKYGGDNSLTYGSFKWYHAPYIAKSHGKELISWEEFMTIAYGVDEGKSSDTDGYETTAGKIEHYPNLTSKFGIEQASGVQWIWGKDVAGNRDEGSTSWAWRDKFEAMGQGYMLHDNHVTAVLLGGSRGYGVYSGSRASHWSSYVWNSSWNIGSRFACDHLSLV